MALIAFQGSKISMPGSKPSPWKAQGERNMGDVTPTGTPKLHAVSPTSFAPNYRSTPSGSFDSGSLASQLPDPSEYSIHCYLDKVCRKWGYCALSAMRFTRFFICCSL